MFVEPGAVLPVRIVESAVVRLDQQPDEWLPFLFGEEGPGALVIRPGAARTCPGLALQQVALPLGIRLASVVPEARQEGEVAASERLCPLARKRGNVAQVVDEELALAVVIGGVSEEPLSVACPPLRVRRSCLRPPSIRLLLTAPSESICPSRTQRLS